MEPVKAPKKRRVDLVMVVMVGAMAVAIGCSLMLGAMGNREPEVYDNPITISAPLPHAKPVTHLVRASRGD